MRALNCWPLRLGIQVFLPRAVGNEDGECFRRWLPPADAKRVPSGVGVHLMAFAAAQISGWLEQPRAESDGLLMRNAGVLDVEIEMHLLRVSIWPVRRNVVRRQLTPTRHLPVASMTLCYPLSSNTWQPRISAQNALSACRSAASNTITVRTNFMPPMVESAIGAQGCNERDRRRTLLAGDGSTVRTASRSHGWQFGCRRPPLGSRCRHSPADGAMT
jgi:hypothetical protein